eukprot:XP_003727777.2 PREDICTED: uncharacterized protein LOC100892083 [Strongylocentrotus purpuratus]
MEDNCIVIYDSEDEGSPLTESKRDSVSSDTGCVDPQDIPSNSAKDLQDNASNSDSDLPDIWGSDNESHKDDDVGRDLPSTSTGRVTASRCGKRHIAIKQEYTSLPPAGKGSAVDSESEVEEEEQFGGIGENSSDGDYNDEEQFQNQIHQNETGNISGKVSDHGDASDSSGDVMTLGVFLKESQSYSQVEPVECKFEDRPWDLHVEDCGSPDAVQSRESPLPPVSSPGSASSIPSRESPLPQVSSPVSASSVPSQESPLPQVSSPVSASSIPSRESPLPQVSSPVSASSVPSRESPLPQVSSPGSASSIPSRESPLPRVSSPGSASSVPSRESPLPRVSSPGSASSVPSRETPLPQVSSPGSASSVPSRESPLPQDHISSGVVRSSDCEADDAVNSDASSTSGTGLHPPGGPFPQFLLHQALDDDRMELKLHRLPLPAGCLSDDGEDEIEDEIKSDSSPEPGDKRPKKNQSAIRKSRRKPQSRNDRSSTDEEDEIKSDSCSEPVDKRPEKNQSAVRKSRRKPHSRNDRSSTDEEDEIKSDSCPEPVDKRPKKNQSAIRKSSRKRHSRSDRSSTDEENQTSCDNVQKKAECGEQSAARRKRKVKGKKRCRDRRGHKKTRGGKSRSLSNAGSLQDPESNQDSTNEDCLQQGQGPEQSGNKDRLPPTNPTPMLNGGTEEEPMDTASDEDMNKLRRRLVIRKVPVVSKSETDSDETCIEDDDLDPSSSQAGGIKSEHPNSDETMIDSNDGDDPGRTENMTSDAVDEVVHNTTTEYFDTQPFSPILHNETEDSLSDADEELHTSEMIVSRDSPSYLLGDKEHDGREAADLEPNSHVSCQSPDEEIHQPQRDDAGLEPSSSHRSNGVNRPSLQREDDSPGQYFPTDSQLSISLDIEDTEELTTLEDDSQDQYFPTDSQLSISLDDVDTEELTTLEDKGQYFPTDSQLSINLENEDTMSIPSKAHSTRGASKNLDKDSGKKLLPCQRNAWCPSELDPQERFLLLQEGDSEHVSSFSQETLFTPSSPGEAPSTSTASPGYLLATSNEQHIPKKNKNFQRPSRADKLLTTMKESDQQKEKNDTKRTDSLQDIPDTPSNTPSLSSKEPSESPSTSMIRSLQDCLQQPASLNSNEMGLEERLPADSRSLSHGHSSIPSVSFPSTSSYSGNISESSRTLNGGHSASSGTSETPSTKPDRLKPTGDDRSACPSDPPDPSLVASDMSKPLKKRRHSQTSSVPSGNQGTEPSKVNQITKEFKQEDVLSCVLSWNADWFDKHKEVHPAEILQSFLTGKEVPKHHACYPDIRSYQEAFLCFLLLEMWSNVSSSVAKDCDRTWRQSSGVNNISGDIVEVQYEAADNPTEPHDLSVGDLVLVDMTTDTASEKQFNFGLVREIGLSDRTICLALHKSIIVPSSTRLKVVTSLSHYLNQIRALLSINSHPLAKHIINPEDSPVFAKDTQVRTEGRVSDDELLNSYMESITSHASRSEVIRLMDGAAGTGKTGFLCRLIQRITRVHKEVPKTFKNPYKLLVCAPTNQSLDVLLRKIWDALMKKMDNAPTGSGRDAMKHIVDGVKIIRVDKAEEADRRLTQFLLSTVMASKRNQGSPYDQLSEDDLQTKILQEADIVGCTLEDCGLEIVRSSLAGNVFALFVDDASHCLETEILLALQCKTKRVFLAGDQEQGIVSIRSKGAQDLEFGHSMLDRLAENFEIEDRRIHRWEVQYRMKEEIAKYPSSVMYLHRLKTRVNHPPFLLHPYIIFDVADGKEILHRDSVVNTSEVSFIEVLVSGFLKLRERFTVGIIAPSEGQKGKLLERLQGKNIPGLVIGTPKNFYGLEKDVIILCCTSTSRTPNENGFVMNKQVLNLALTRSKYSLIIVGNMRSLQKMSSNWKFLVHDATGRQLVFRTSQASYSQDAKNCHKETIPSSSRPEMPLRTVSEGRPPPGQQQRGVQDGNSRRSEDSYRHRHNPWPQDNPAHGSGRDPMEADAVMPAGANYLPPGVDPGSRSSQALNDEGNAPIFVEEQHVPYAPRNISQSQKESTSSNGVEENRTSRHKHVSGDAGIDNRGKRRVHFDTGTEDHGRAAKVPRSSNYNQGASSSVKSFGRRRHSFPSSRDSAQPRSILKKPDGNVASTSHHNLRSHSPSIASTAPGISVSSSSTPIPQRQRRNSSGLDASLDTEDGKSLREIATGMRANERLPRQQKGQVIAGHTVGKRKPQSSKRTETIEHSGRERRPSGEATSAGTSQRRNSSNGNEAGQNQSRDHQQQEGGSDQRPRRQSCQQQVSPDRQDHGRSVRRSSGEVTGARTSLRQNGSNGNEIRQNQGRGPALQNSSDQRPQRQCRQPQPYIGIQVLRRASLNQLAYNPVQHDRNMLHNRIVNEAYGGRSTALTEPRPNLRRGKR